MEKRMSITTLAVAQAEREDCIYCIPPFKLYCFPNILRNEKLRNKWIRALKRQNKGPELTLSQTLRFALSILLAVLMK